jgi:hypothetical protein
VYTAMNNTYPNKQAQQNTFGSITLQARTAILNAADDARTSDSMQPERKPDQSRGSIPKGARKFRPINIFKTLLRMECLIYINTIFSVLLAEKEIIVLAKCVFW